MVHYFFQQVKYLKTSIWMMVGIINLSSSQVLAAELEQLKLQKQSLEVHIAELQHVRETELQQYTQQLSALEQELSVVVEERDEARNMLEQNQNLSLELEKEKGRLAGKIICQYY